MLVPLTGSHLAGVAKAARRSLSLIYKKTNQWDDAAELWEDMIGSDPLDVFAVEELAKFYEHHARKYEQALKIVHRVLDEARHLGETERRSLEHRMQRLWSKTASR